MTIYGTWLIDLFPDSLEQALDAVLHLAPLLILVHRDTKEYGEDRAPGTAFVFSGDLCAH